LVLHIDGAGALDNPTNTLDQSNAGKGGEILFSAVAGMQTDYGPEEPYWVLFGKFPIRRIGAAERKLQ